MFLLLHVSPFFPSKYIIAHPLPWVNSTLSATKELIVHSKGNEL
jgi:hypothetical protein